MTFLEDEEKRVVLERYFDIEWRDDVSDLRCVRCHRVAINHYVSTCQHIFCHNCSKFYSDAGRQSNCPQCQERISQPDDKDFEVEVQIHQLKICCPNKKFGCVYTDQLRKIPSHLLTCTNKQEVALQMGTPKINTMEDVSNMIAFKVIEKFNQLERKTDDTDRKVNALRERMESVDKKVEGVELASKKNTEELQSIKSLLESVNQRIQQTSSNMEEMRIKMAAMTQEIRLLQNKRSEESNILKAESCEWTIKEVAKTTLKNDWIYETDVLRFTGYKYNIKAKLEEKEGRIAIRLQFKDGDIINHHINKSGLTKIEYVIRDQENIEDKKDIINVVDLKFCESNNRPSWIFGHELRRGILSPPYMKNDCIKITIRFETSSMDSSSMSNNGILEWRMDNYKTRMQKQIYSNLWSPSFYTSPRGYRVRSRIIVKTSQKVFLEVYFLAGKHDETLSEIFPHTTTVTLFNQTDPSKTLVKTEQRDKIRFYAIELESIKFIEENGFIKDDSLHLDVAIIPQLPIFRVSILKPNTIGLNENC